MINKEVLEAKKRLKLKREIRECWTILNEELRVNNYTTVRNVYGSMGFAIKKYLKLEDDE